MVRVGFAIEGISNLKILGPLLHRANSQAIPIEASYQTLCATSDGLMREADRAHASFEAYNKKFNGLPEQSSSDAILRHLAQAR